MIRICLLVCMIVGTFSVSAQAQYITIGSGGGVTGTATAYKITAKGKVYKGSGVAKIHYTECSKLKRSIAKKDIAAIAEESKLLAPFTHPGNLYFFMTYVENGSEQTLMWGDLDHPVPDKVKKLYEEIHKEVSALDYKPIE